MRFVEVRQRLASAPLSAVGHAVRQRLDEIGPPPQGEVAVTVGSRGIANLPEITRAAGEWLRDRGADPFAIPAMGSHNGATAEGQREMLETLGCSEEALGMPIRSSMECVPVGDGAWIDRNAYEAAGVLLINRVKLHTCFAGPLGSGLAKMAVVGLGKVAAAEALHSHPAGEMADALRRMASGVLASGKVWGGLAILEDGYDQTAELHAVSGDQILSCEPRLLERHRDYFPSLPLSDLGVLIVDEIGKTHSGAGMDPNVIGRHVDEAVGPRVGVIAALGLSESSRGNATGVGLADFITRRLRDAIDEHKTFLNAYTTGDMQRAKIPATLHDDEEVFERVRTRYGDRRWAVIANTRRLDRFWVSEDLADEIASHERCQIASEPTPVRFSAGRHNLVFLPLNRDAPRFGEARLLRF